MSPVIGKLSACLSYRVTDANTVDIFKLRLDKFWKDQDVYYGFTCDIAGTGDRSEYYCDLSNNLILILCYAR